MDPRGFIAFVSILIGTSPFVDAAALGLGDAELRSRLNEPLEVEIDVVGAAPQSDGLNATIGTKARRYSADPAALALSSRLRAEVTIDAAGRAHIRVTTKRAVREPVVSFLLVVENAREHVMREYTLLLDPPGYSVPVLTRPEPVRAAVLEPAPAIPVPATPAPPTPNLKIDTERIGPVASFKIALVVKRLPKTRSGKVLRSTIRNIADGDAYQIPATIDDPAILSEIEAVLSAAGLPRI